MNADILDRSPVPELPEPGERKRLRELFGVSQGEIAAYLGVSRQTIIRYEKEESKGGSAPKGDIRIKYAQLLKTWQETEKE